MPAKAAKPIAPDKTAKKRRRRTHPVSDDTDDNKCIVCMDEVPQVTLLPCRHRDMCLICCDQWVGKHGTCPTCRCDVIECR